MPDGVHFSMPIVVMKRIAACAFASGIASMGLAGSAAAHPHVFADARLEVVVAHGRENAHHGRTERHFARFGGAISPDALKRIATFGEIIAGERVRVRVDFEVEARELRHDEGVVEPGQKRLVFGRGQRVFIDEPGFDFEPAGEAFRIGEAALVEPALQGFRFIAQAPSSVPTVFLPAPALVRTAYRIPLVPEPRTEGEAAQSKPLRRYAIDADHNTRIGCVRGRTGLTRVGATHIVWSELFEKGRARLVALPR